ncbi:MAG: bifunctional riboflavin kinase/FAD synthetase [Thermotogaceae bacterium]|nr:bifunctional riboflavin kinase/FAD synthetase [Thermotogaceae bacterium]
MGYAVTIGVYDGVHIGHQKILQKLGEIANKKSLITKVYTILYPMEYYSSGFKGLLMTPQERIVMLQEFAEEVEFLDLAEIFHLPHEEFFQFLVENDTKAIVVGEDFRYGYKGMGNINTLRESSEKHGIELYVMKDILCDGGIRISSSRIRELISRGKMERVREILGRYYKIFGKVYRDMGLGRKLGYPTANVDRGHERLVIPKLGVYFSRVKIGDEYFFGVTNIGRRPTVKEEAVVKYETYILDFDRDIYDRRIEVELIKYLRGEEKFSSLGELKNAIANDVKTARELIGAWSEK